MYWVFLIDNFSLIFEIRFNENPEISIIPFELSENAGPSARKSYSTRTRNGAPS